MMDRHSNLSQLIQVTSAILNLVFMFATSGFDLRLFTGFVILALLFDNLFIHDLTSYLVLDLFLDLFCIY